MSFISISVIGRIVLIISIIFVALLIFFAIKTTKDIYNNRDNHKNPQKSGGFYQMPDKKNNNNIAFTQEKFILKEAKENIHKETKEQPQENFIVSYGRYSTSAVQTKFVSLSNIKFELEKSNSSVRIDRETEIYYTGDLLPDQIKLVNNLIKIESTKIVPTEFKNFYLPNGYNTKTSSVGEELSYNYFSQAPDAKYDPDVILCCISFNFLFQQFQSSQAILNKNNKCITIDKVDNSRFTNEGYNLENKDSYDIDYSFNVCNTYDARQKFIVKRYNWDKESNSFVSNKTGIYASIQHKSFCSDTYFLIFDISAESGKEFKLKKFDTSTNDHIIWLFLPEVNITKPTIPSTSHNIFNSWVKFKDLSKLRESTNNFIIGLGKGAIDTATGKNAGLNLFDAKDTSTTSFEILRRAENLLLNYYMPLASPIVVKAIFNSYKILLRLFELGFTNRQNKFYNVKYPVPKNTKVVPGEYQVNILPFDDMPSYKNNVDLIIKDRPQNYDTYNEDIIFVYGTSLKDLAQKNFYKNDFRYLNINNNIPNNTPINSMPSNITTYPLLCYQALNDGFVGNKGFTGIIEPEKLEFDQGRLVAKKVTLTPNDNFDVNKPIFFENNITWLKVDPYKDTTTFRNDYFMGLKNYDGSKSSIKTENGLSFVKVVASPFFPELDVSDPNNLLNNLQIKNGVCLIQPYTENLGKKNLTPGLYTFKPPFITTDNNGKNIEINISMEPNYVKNYSISYPGTNYEVDDVISININGDSSDTSTVNTIKFKVKSIIEDTIEPRFDIINFGNGHDLKLNIDGIKLIENIPKLQLDPTNLNDMITVDYGGLGYKDGELIAITATNQLNDLMKISFVFECFTETNENRFTLSRNEEFNSLLEESHHLYAGLITSDPNRLKTNSNKPEPDINLNNKFIFDLTDTNFSLADNPLISPPQIAYAGTSMFRDAGKYYGISTSVSTIRDIFTGLDEGESIKTLTKVLTKRKEEDVFNLNQINKDYLTYRYLLFSGQETVCTTNSSMIFLGTLQFPELNYGTTTGNGAINNNSKLHLSNWIPYKRLDVYKQKLYNPAPGVPILNKTEYVENNIDDNPLNIVNYNNAAIIPFGIDNIYNKVINSNQIPSF